MCLSVPGRVEKIEGLNAIVDFGGSKRNVSTMLFPDIACGDYVLVHAGFIIQKLDPEEAIKTIETFKEIYNEKD